MFYQLWIFIRTRTLFYIYLGIKNFLANLFLCPQIAYSSQAQQHAIPYSSAADVSSFSYSSPVVSYNSRGLFQQLAGKAPAGTAQAATYSQPTKVQYITVPRTKSAPVSYSPAKASSQSSAATYASSPSAYSASPSAYSQPGTPSAHSGTPTTYSEAVASQPSYAVPAAAGIEDGSAAYQQVAQKAAAYTRPQAIVYQSNPAEHRVNYVPSPDRYQASQKAAAQPVQYIRTAPQTFENADHSTQQYIYVQPQAARQYYAVPSQKQGVTYAQ
nr:unnamed protein product [Callosobruchus analis]